MIYELMMSVIEIIFFDFRYVNLSLFYLRFGINNVIDLILCSVIFLYVFYVYVNKIIICLFKKILDYMVY